MQRSLLFKLITILALTLVIFIAIGLIANTISERSQFRKEAVASISAESVREQTVIGPVVIIPYNDQFEELIHDNGVARSVTRTVKRQHMLFPTGLQVDGSIDTDRRYRGIHQVLVYTGHHKFTGDFVMPVKTDLPRANASSRLTLGQPVVALGIEDVRGIRDIPKINWGGAVVEFQQGSALRSFNSGVHATLPLASLEREEQVKFAFNLVLDGIERQHFAPVGKNNVITLKSAWAHPQFAGQFLPMAREREVSDKGFSATWRISSMSTSTQQQLLAMEEKAAPREATLAGLDRFSVGFIEPVNVYSMAERATKYGLLFVVLTFAAFFIFEVLKRLPIHPVQYLLVGLALALFFLLLVGLSEHIAFLHAYLIASAGCIVLIGFYLSFVLHDWRRGMGFGTALTALYGALYMLLISENNALVMGSILLFAILAAVMVATRKVDWYQIGKSEPEPAR
ncbi:MAG: cell envelope integrity protein CreD [Pseudomonadota bacterium]